MDVLKITVATEFLPEHSDWVHDRYAFAYHIGIANQGSEVLILRRRHWEITDALAHTEVVDGEGVVGQQPVLVPGERFEYSSGAQLRTPWGQMQGRYQFERADGSRFWAPIPQFELKAPVRLQ